MARELDEIELRLRQIVAVERSRVRGRHSRMATAELNTSIPRIEREFWASVQAGSLPDLTEFFPIDGESR